MTNIAPAVSRLLKKSDFMIVATRTREGIHVTRLLNGGACVAIQHDGNDRKAARLANEAATVLRTKGYYVKQDGTLLFVEKTA